jgi:glycosyltransferase involved in cell wall biosynthesis
VKPRVCLVVDSGTDVRLVDGLTERSTLRVIARRVPGGREISHTPAGSAIVEIGPSGRLSFALFAVRRLLVLRRQVDTVVVQGYGPTALAVNAAGRAIRRVVLMLVCSPAEEYYRCRTRAGSNRKYRRSEYWIVRACAWMNARIGFGYVALSPYLASVVRAHGTQRSVDVIPVYGVDRQVFHRSRESKRETRRRLDLPDDLPLVFFSSRIAPEKDAETLLEAVRRLAERNRPVRVLHLSGGYEEFASHARRLGVERYVIARDATPPFDALADCYRAADLCVQTSHAEGLGFSPLEAVSCGVPVVASAVGGLKDTIREGETGWQVPPGDPEKLAHVILRVLNDPAEAARRTRLAAQQVDRLYERRIVFDQFVDRLAPL